MGAMAIDQLVKLRSLFGLEFVVMYMRQENGDELTAHLPPTRIDMFEKSFVFFCCWS